MVSTVRHLGAGLGGWVLRERRQGGSASKAGLSRRMRVAAERLGPTYIKLGQIISSGEGLFPDELVDEFSAAATRCRPSRSPSCARSSRRTSAAPVERCSRPSIAQPLAAASIAQVHAATLRTGEDVVVKVQRPSVGERVHADLRVMAWLAPLLVGRIPIAALANPPALVELFAETITEELDFRLEAENMLDVAARLRRPRPARLRHPPSPPRAGDAARPGDGAARGFAFDDAVGMQGAGIDTEAVVQAG